MSGIPYVIEKGPNDQERSYDLYSRLLKDRIIFVREEFNQEMADSIVAQLLFLESADPEQDIFMYINSPGGCVSAMFGIFDVMNYIKPDIATIGYGHCMSAGSFLLASATKGKRSILPNTQVMIHELSTGNHGKFNDIKVQFEHTQKLYDRMAEYYASFTGQKLVKIKRDMERDCYLTAAEALSYGLVDKIYDKRG